MNEVSERGRRWGGGGGREEMDLGKERENGKGDESEMKKDE